MNYSLRSVDVNEMWGSHDTLERLQYNGKDLDFKYKWKCRERVDYLKVEWIVRQLNRRKTTLKNLNQTLKSLERSWLSVKNRVELKRERDRLRSTDCPFKIDEIKRNIEIIKKNHIFERNEKKYLDLKKKIHPFHISLLTGHVRNVNKQKITKDTIRVYNKIRQYFCWKEPRLDDFIIVGRGEIS